MRYFNILILTLALGAVGLVGDWLLQASGSGLSLRDPRGAGQIMMFVLVLCGIALFLRFVAGVSIREYFLIYARNWWTALRGLLWMLGFASLVVIAGYLFLGLMGNVGWSQSGWANLTPKVVERTIVALLVVLILATSEELIFRGFVLRYLRWNDTLPVTIAAIIGSAAIFSVSHVISKTAQPMTAELLFGLFMLGMLLGTTYVATGSLACSIGVHAGLLGSKVFLRKTNLIEIDPNAWWLGSADLRMAPIVWVLFAGMSLVVLLGYRFRNRLAVEDRVIIADSARSEALAARPNPAE